MSACSSKSGNYDENSRSRAAYAVIGLIYVGLAFSAVKIVLGARSPSGSLWSQSWTAWLLAQPFGQGLVGIVGAIVVGVGLYQFYQTYSAKFRKKLFLNEMSGTEEKWAMHFGRFGFAARGIVFCIIGFFLFLAAYQTDVGESRGLGGALHTVEQ